MKRKFSISAGAILLLSALYFFGGAETLAALLLAVSVHEAGHFAALKAFGAKTKRLRFDASGLCMSFAGLTGALKPLVATMAGPFAGLALAYALSYIGGLYGNEFALKAAAYSLLLSLFNLLPALPLDGGCGLFYIISALQGRRKAERTLEITGMLSAAVLLIGGLFLLGSYTGEALLMAGVWILLAQSGIVKNFRLL